MAEATRSRGYQYFGVADHSKSAHYAGGLSVQEIAEQQAEADALNKKYRSAFTSSKASSSDILADGSLDYPDDVLARLSISSSRVSTGDSNWTAKRRPTASSARSSESVYDHPRSYDRTATAAPPRL